MSIKGTIDEGIGFAEEEIGEATGNNKLAKKGRNKRNQGRIANHKAPKLTTPGTGHPED